MSIRISRYRLDMGNLPVKAVSQLNFNSSPGDDHTASGIILSFTAGVAMNFGDAGYIDPTTGKVLLANATVIATSSAFVMCADASIAQDLAGLFLIHGVVRDDTWTTQLGNPPETPLAAGGLVYASTTGITGTTLTQTAPTATDSVTQILGVAIHDNRIYFNPQLVQIEHS